MKKIFLISESTKNYIKEYIEIDDKQYYDALIPFFEKYMGQNAPNVVNFLSQNDQQMTKMFSQQFDEQPKIKSIKTDGGNLLIKYADFEQAKFLMVLGIVKTSELNRQDVASFSKIVDVLLSKLKQGYQMQASSNEKSMAFVHKIKEIGNKKGMNLSLESLAEMNFPIPVNASNEDFKKFFHYKHFVLYDKSSQL